MRCLTDGSLALPTKHLHCDELVVGSQAKGALHGDGISSATRDGRTLKRVLENGVCYSEPDQETLGWN